MKRRQLVFLPGEPKRFRQTLIEAMGTPGPRLIRTDRCGKVNIVQWGVTRGRTGLQHDCVCDCGRKLRLPSRCLWFSRMLDEGCVHETCLESSLTAKYWANIDFSLRQQWANLLFSTPHKMDPQWGGQVMRGYALVDEETGLSRFLRHVEPYIHMARGKIWVGSKNTALPLTPDTLRIAGCARASIPVWNYIRIAGNYLQYTEAAELLHVEETVLRALHRALFFSERVIKNLSVNLQSRLDSRVQILSNKREIAMESYT